MGVKFVREYENILSDLVDIIVEISDIYTFFDMPEDTWKYLGRNKKRSYIETLADDLFFALGTESEFNIGSGKIVYNTKIHALEIFNNGIQIGSVNLI
jgi:hypothetical protein